MNCCGMSLVLILLCITACSKKPNRELQDPGFSASKIGQGNDSIVKKNAFDQNIDSRGQRKFSDYIVNKDSVYEFDVYYQLRKGKHYRGESVWIDGLNYAFLDNLILVDTVSLAQYPVGRGNNEIAPGVIRVEDYLDLQAQDGYRYKEYWTHHLIYLNEDLSIKKKIVLSDLNPISHKDKKITTYNQFDGETNVAYGRSRNPSYDIQKNTDHYWTRRINLTANDAGFVTVNYALSLRDNNDDFIDDLNSIVVLDKNGNVMYHLDSLFLDIGNMTLSLCGEFLLIQYGGICTANMDVIRDAGTTVYELKTGKEILHFNHHFKIPIYEMESNFLIMGYDNADIDRINYFQVALFFNFSKREYYMQKYSNSQWKEIELNWQKIRQHSKLLEIYPYETIKF